MKKFGMARLRRSWMSVLAGAVGVGATALACGETSPDAIGTDPQNQVRASDGGAPNDPSRDGGLPFDTDPNFRSVLKPVLDAVSAEASTRSPGSEVALAAYDFVTGEYAGSNDEETFISASSAKAIWVAAALDRVGIDAVAPYAKPIFESSSNPDSTEVIKLVGPNNINPFYVRAGMVKSGFTQWMGQKATNSPRLMGDDNYFTTRDAISFLRALETRTLLDDARQTVLDQWMTWSPRSGYGGWLGTKLPSGVRTTLRHKAGWLPPPYDARAVNEIGIVEASPGHRYAVAIFSRAATDYDAEQAYVEYASCRIYAAVANDATNCN